MMEQRLQSGLAALNLPVEGIPALVRYGDLLIETNKVMNLTAITDPEDVATLHFLDSAALLTLESFSGSPWWTSAPVPVFPVCPCGCWSPPSA